MTAHTTVPRGKRVRIVTTGNSTFFARYVDKTSASVLLDVGGTKPLRLRTREIRSMTIAR